MNLITKFLTWAITLAGTISGKIWHLLRGCQPFYKLIVVNGKLRRKICKQCGKRYDRVNGKWKYFGKYGNK